MLEIFKNLFAQEDEDENESKNKELNSKKLFESLKNDCKIKFGNDIASTLYNSSKFSDLTIKIGKSSFKVHKCIIYARSKYLKKFDLKNDVIEIKDKSLDELIITQYLRFIYTGEISDNLGPEDLIRLGSSAEIMDCEDLKLLTKFGLKDSLNVEKVLKLLSDDKYKGDEKFKDSCLDFILQNWSKLIKSNEIYSIDDKLFIQMIKHDNLEGEELSVFETCLERAKQIEKKDGVKLKEQMSKYAPYIRFQYIEPSYIEQKIIPLDLIDEKYLIDAFLYHLNPSQEANVKMRYPKDNFVVKWAFGNGTGYTVTKGLSITNNSGGHKGITGNKLLKKGRHAWRITLTKLNGYHWLLIGITGNANPNPYSSYSDPLTYGFASPNQCYEKGVNTGKLSDFHSGNVVDVLLDLFKGKLKFYNHSSKKEYELVIDKSIGYYPHFNIYNQGNSFKVNIISPSRYKKK